MRHEVHRDTGTEVWEGRLRVRGLAPPSLGLERWDKYAEEVVPTCDELTITLIGTWEPT